MAVIRHGTVSGTTVMVDLGGNYRNVEVLNRDGADELWIQIDPSDDSNLSAQADDLEVIPAAIGSLNLTSRASGSTRVKLYAATATKYSIKAE